MLCAKCHKNDATVHLTTVVTGHKQDTVHLCEDCAPAIAGLPTLDPKKLEALSVIGKKCEFCGKDAYAGQMTATGGAIYWCFDCGQEFSRIFTDLVMAERPDLMQRSPEASSFMTLWSDPELQAWSAAASQRAVRILKDRRRQDGRGARS